MNTNELADKLEQGHWEGGTREQVATMLRQQHSELKELKLARLADLDVILKQRAEIELLFKEIPEFEKVFSNEPVAYVTGLNKFDSKMVDTVLKVGTPLYTHPASLVDWSYQQGYQVGKETHLAKTLTDEEIAKLADDILGYQIYGYKESGVYEFARAILRKASE